MGYDLHITRRQDWCDVGNDISKEEFIALVKANAEFYYPSDNDED